MKKQKMTPLSFLVNESVKNQAREVLESLGLNMTDAMRMFLVQVVNRQGIPFEIRGPNAETLKSMQAIKSKQYSKPYNTAEEMFTDLDKQIAEEIDEE